jgi:putative FmdB family regulatory protein
MPIYLYECESCGIRFEKLQRMSQEPLTECPECDGHVHRVIQPVGIIFKGSGFYITDNRRVSSPTLTPPKDTDKTDKADKADKTDKTETKEKAPAGKEKESKATSSSAKAEDA